MIRVSFGNVSPNLISEIAGSRLKILENFAAQLLSRLPLDFVA